MQRLLLATTTLACAAAQTLLGQTVTGGVVGGTHFTNNFLPRYESGPVSNFRFETGPRSAILGVTLEGKLSNSFSIEANVLNRPMKRTITFAESSPFGTGQSTATAVRTWQFPILLKYQFEPVQIAKARPFLTIGPSFRTYEDPSGAKPSQIGLTMGAGFTVPIGRLRLSPTLRYTRWRRESIFPRYATKPDQLEILGSLAYETDAAGRRFAGRHLEIGGLLGLGLTDGFERIGPGAPDRERFRYMAGLTARIDANERLSFEIDGIYKPLRAVDRISGIERGYSIITWQFPVLAKYRLAERGVMPFVTGGPSFRLAGNLNGHKPSMIGATVGAGLELRVGVARWSYALRYTRWARDDARLQTNPNALEGVVGLSF